MWYLFSGISHSILFIDTEPTRLEQHTSLCIILSVLQCHLEILVWDWSSTVVGTALHIKYRQGVHVSHSHSLNMPGETTGSKVGAELIGQVWYNTQQSQYASCLAISE